MTATAAAAGTRRHTGTYPAEPWQVGLARAALAGWLGGCPQADEAILVASEFATNSVRHSASRHGGAFILRAEVGRDRLPRSWVTFLGRTVAEARSSRIQSVAVQVAPPTVTVIRAPGGGPLR